VTARGPARGAPGGGAGGARERCERTAWVMLHTLKRALRPLKRALRPLKRALRPATRALTRRARRVSPLAPAPARSPTGPPGIEGTAPPPYPEPPRTCALHAARTQLLYKPKPEHPPGGSRVPRHVESMRAGRRARARGTGAVVARRGAWDGRRLGGAARAPPAEMKRRDFRIVRFIRYAWFRRSMAQRSVGKITAQR
jgi:hypothetical protein